MRPPLAPRLGQDEVVPPGQTQLGSIHVVAGDRPWEEERISKAAPPEANTRSVVLEIRLLDASMSGTVAPVSAGLNPDRLLLTVSEAAKCLAVSRSALYQLLGREIPVIRLGRAVRVPHAALREFVAARVEGNGGWR